MSKLPTRQTSENFRQVRSLSTQIKNTVATYDGTPLNVTGDVELKSITGLSKGGTIDNGMLINLQTTDDAKYQLAFTDINGGTADWSNAKTDVIMQGNIHGMNSGGSNLLGGSGTNDFLAGSGDNVYLGTGKNNVYLNENRNGGVGIYAYDNLIDTDSSGNSSDLADGQSADSTGEKNYSSVVNNFKFGFNDNSDILYVSGKSSFFQNMVNGRSSIVLIKNNLKCLKRTYEKINRNSDGSIVYQNKVNLKTGSRDAANGSAFGNVDYTKLILGYEDGTVKTAIAGKGAVMNLDWRDDERAEEYVGENSGVDVGEKQQHGGDCAG